MSRLLTIKEIEQVAVRLRPYGLRPEDAQAVADALVQAVDGPVPVQASDLSALMRPRRPAPVPDPEVRQRRAAMREKVEEAFSGGPPPGGAFVVYHHRDDAASAASAVQHRARKAGLTWKRERIEDGKTLFTWLGYVAPSD